MQCGWWFSNPRIAKKGVVSGSEVAQGPPCPRYPSLGRLADLFVGGLCWASGTPPGGPGWPAPWLSQPVCQHPVSYINSGLLGPGLELIKLSLLCSSSVALSPLPQTKLLSTDLNKLSLNLLWKGECDFLHVTPGEGNGGLAHRQHIGFPLPAQHVCLGLLEYRAL